MSIKITPLIVSGLLLQGLAACTSSSPNVYQQQLLLENEPYRIEDTERLLRCLYERRAERGDRYTKFATAAAISSAALSFTKTPSAQLDGVVYQSDETLRQQCLQALRSTP